MSAYADPVSSEPAFDSVQWHDSRAEHDGAGGRMVLGWALAVLAAVWIGFTAWSAGRALVGAPLSSPAVAQWVAVVTGPLALLGLTWLMFGRTRRKEAEKFTASVIAMRGEAQSLEALLAVLATRIGESHRALNAMSGELMGLGEETAQRLGTVTRELDAGSQRLSAHGAALDQAAAMARTDIGVLLADLPLAEARAVAMAEQLRDTGGEAARQAAAYEASVGSLSERTREANAVVGEAAGRLVTHLTHIEGASAAARAQLDESSAAHRAEIEGLLGHAAQALESIRSGIDAQAAAVGALVAQSSAGLGQAGIESAEALGNRLSSARGSLDGLSARIAEQERASQRLVADLDQGLGALDERFLHLAQEGDHRATTMLGALGRVRGELTSLGEQAGAHDGLVEGLADRTETLRRTVEMLTGNVREALGGALGEAEGSAARLVEQTEAARPAVAAVRDAAVEASERLASGTQAVETQHDRLAELLAAVDTGIGGAETRLAQLGAAIGNATGEAERLSHETGPALVAAMVQVREAAGHAAERAREAIAAVIPESAANLSEAARTALEAAVQATVAEQLRDVERVAVRAVEAAQQASERLTRQMLTIGQSASALEAHVERTQQGQRQHDSDEFAKKVALLIDSMHSASIDVGKILADEVDDKNWTAYLKGNRGIFTRRAARLLGGGETRAMAAHYEADQEFAASVNRYVADFEAMLRRVLAERDGGMMAVTMMSSDVGKLYAALAGAVERKL
ncbi:MAG: hypothetical protein ABIO85_01170 [Sphingomicrobium sp.]